MGMFGKGSSMGGPQSFGDVLSIIGASLKDADPESQGGNLIRTQVMLGARAQDAQKKQFLSQLGGMLGPQYVEGSPSPTVAPRGLFGGSAPANLGDGSALPSSASRMMAPEPAAPYEYKPPQKVSDGLSINDPRMAGLTIAAQQAGVPIDDLIKVLTAQQPDVRFDRGFGYNGKTGGAMGGFHPDLDKGQGLDANGGVINLPGAVDAAAAMAGGVEGAKAKAQAPYSFQTMMGPNGNPIVVSNATAAALGSQGGVVAKGQSPAEAAAEKARAEATAAAQINLPATVQTAQQALDAINGLKTDKALSSRVGLLGVLPAIPGTPGADFDARVDQLKGKLFMEAYAGLKGGGQITEVEGKKATEAIGRLNTRQSPEGFNKALDDLSEVIKAGQARAQRQAGGITGSSGRAPPQIGQVVKGYRYLGGDPASPKSWAR